MYYPQKCHEYLKAIAIEFIKASIVNRQAELAAMERIEDSQEFTEVSARHDAKSLILHREYLHNVEREAARVGKSDSVMEQLLATIKRVGDESQPSQE